VSDIDEGLKKLNLGVSAWAEVSHTESSPEDSTYEVEEIGYAKVGGKWGIALRIRSGDDRHPEREETVEEWPFNEAARASRLRAFGKIPEVLNKLNQEASKATKELQVKLADAQAVAVAVQEAAGESKLPSGRARVARIPLINTPARGFTPPLPLNTPAAGFSPPPARPKSEVKP
jgi:hypothetical protein